MLNKKGMLFIGILAMIIVMGGIAVSNMILQDVFMIKRLKYDMQAEYLAEAGISAALASLAQQFSTSIFPLTADIGNGSYTVTIAQTGGRNMLTSVGTVAASEGGLTSVEKTVSAEVLNNTPTSMNYIESAGNDVIIQAGVHNGVIITGSVHANKGCHLNTANGQGDMSISNTVTYTNDNVYISVGNGADCLISINGTAYPRKTTTTKPAWSHTPVTFPVFDDAYYRKIADPSLGGGGEYYSASHTFTGATLSPGNGLVYVNGTATFSGTCHINGGVFAKAIVVTTDSKLYQHKTGNYNMLVANGVGTGLGSIIIGGELHVEEALLYSKSDFRASGKKTVVDVHGVITASQNIDLSDFQVVVNYTYLSPNVDLGSTSPCVSLVSWNQ